MARHEAAKVEPATGKLAVTKILSMKGGARAAAARHGACIGDGCGACADTVGKVSTRSAGAVVAAGSKMMTPTKGSVLVVVRCGIATRTGEARRDDRSNEGGSAGGLTTRVPKRAGLLEVGRNEASQAAPMTGDLAAVGRGESHDGESRR